MVDAKKLPYLIDLLDDPSEDIRSAILKELELFGIALEDEIHNLDIQIDPGRRVLLDDLFEKNDRIWLKRIWQSVFDADDNMQQLEKGLHYICDFQNGRFYPRKLSPMLDALAKEYLVFHEKPDHFQLVHFLMHQKNLKGAEQDYYNPLNSNLVYVLEKGYGIPISLAAILMLTGKRLGLEFEGCNFPGHFLARFTDPVENEIILVDCYNNGQLIYESDIDTLEKDTFKHLIDVAYEKTTAYTMLKRVIGNLANAYKKSSDQINNEFFEALLEHT
jgi:regulator of sirC expression with transglutaminase-like and TPR domain